MSNWDRRVAYLRSAIHFILGIVLIIAGLAIWETALELLLLSIFGMTLIAVGIVALRDKQLGDRLNNATIFVVGVVSVAMWLM